MERVNSNRDLLSLTSFCKGLAIIAVILVHWKGGWFGWQGVHIFIVLSGFGLGYSCFKKDRPPQWKSWFKRRFRRILPVYWLAVWISAVILLCFDLHDFKHTLVRTVLDTVLLTNVFEYFRGGATGAFWFVPFIIGAYLLFPTLYDWLKQHPTWGGCLSLMVGILILEWGYRAIAIYLLDGQPIAHDTPFIQFIPNSVAALDQQPDWLYGLFQRRAPFGFIPARMAEFTLGVLAGFTYARHPQRTQGILLNRSMAGVGLMIWLGGQGLLYVGLWGWIFSDFIIALGLILWMVNLAAWTQCHHQRIFQYCSTLGVSAYYLYLIHHPFTRLGPQLVYQFSTDAGGRWQHLGLTVGIFSLMMMIVSGLSWLLMKFDHSSGPDWMIDQVFTRLDAIQTQLLMTWHQRCANGSPGVLAFMMFVFLMPKIILQAGFWIPKTPPYTDKMLLVSSTKSDQSVSNQSSDAAQ